MLKMFRWLLDEIRHLLQYKPESHPTGSKRSHDSSVQPDSLAAAFCFSILIHTVHLKNGKNYGVNS